MNNYSKGKNEEEEWQKDKISIPDLPSDFIWMQVSAGSKMRNLLEAAWRKLDSTPHIVWSGSGAGINKAISCAEITKKKFNLTQKISVCYRNVKEYWDPKLPNLDQLVVIREIPAIHIYLYKDS